MQYLSVNFNGVEKIIEPGLIGQFKNDQQNDQQNDQSYWNHCEILRNVWKDIAHHEYYINYW